MMRSTTVDKLAELQKKPTQVRNICILAHVDHGKTTLADALVASNGIISQKMAGKLRYMDNREDEQTRGITMKSSAISLHYQNDTDKYLVNLIDSPGHVDFSSEVSTAVRLCDGAIVVVDVVEGVCPQTHAVLRQAWLENIKPILVLNKIDRLITELKMEPLEAFGHLQRILEHMNIVTSELFTADIMSMQTTNSSEENGSESQNCDWTEDADEMEHKNIYFTPDQGNVVFACAYDGWGFTVAQFAEIYSKKLGMNEEGLRKTLWGDFFLNSKTKRIMKGAQGKGKKPLFVQFVLDSIWSVYDVVMVRRDKDMMEKIIKSLSLKIAPRDLRHNDPRVQLQAVMSQWLPVSNIVLSAVVDKLPSPVEIMEEKVEKLMCNQARRFDSLPQQTQELKDAFLACKSTDDAPVIVFVSKMFPVDKSVLPKNKQRPLTDEELQRRGMEARQRHAARLEGAQNMTSDNDTQQDTASGTLMECMKEEKADVQTDDQDQVFIAFARVYSGTLRAGQKLYVLGPKHDPAMALEKLSEGSGVDSSMKLADLPPEDHMTVVTVTDLYLFMGRELESLDSVPAGNVLGIGGLEDHILKSGTLTSTVACPAFTDLYFDVSPILRVAVEPVNAGDMPQLMKGLKLLNQADPCVQVLVQETGEHVIITAGEVHLRRCLEDLKKRYGKVSIMASSPIVPFRETIVPPPTVDMVNESIQEQNPQVRNEKLKEFEEDNEILEEGLVKIFTPSKHCMVQIRAVPLPPEVTDFLEENQVLIKTLDQYVSSKLSERRSAKYQDSSKLKHSTKESIKEFKEKLDNLFVKAGKCWSGCADSIWAFGPKRVGPNLLLNQVEGYNRTSLWEYVSREKKESVSYLRDYDYSVISGFQLATLTGPLCEEPMRGVCFIIEKWDIGINTLNSKGAECNSNGDASKTKDIKGRTMEGESSDGIGISLTKLSLNNALDNTDIQVVDMLHSGKSYDCDTNKIDQSDKSTSISCENEQDQASCSYKLNSEITMENGKASNEADNSDSDSDVDSVTSSKRSEVQGHVSGQLISIVKEGCRKGFQTQPQRLMAAMYKCTVQTTAEVLGKMYGVIGKRNGRILGEDMREGSQMFSIDAVIPVVESLGFADDIRKKTSGLASPQLVFSHWEVIDVDPFWVPTTEEEIMHYGEKADSENRARVYMNSVRERKGLKVDKKIVEHAEKQRTLTKNK